MNLPNKLPDPNPRQLLYSRRQAARVLGTSVATVIRLERAGRLRAVKLTGSEQSQVFYRAAELEQLAK